VGFSRGAAEKGRRCQSIACCLALLVSSPLAKPLYAQKISVSGSPGTLVITTAVAGQGFTSVSNSSTTYSLTGNPTRINKVIAQLNAPMPGGVTLSLRLVPPSGATSLGSVALDATARDVLTNIPPSAKGDVLAMTYTLSATAAAGVIPLSSRTVTLTIVDLP
jgi:hypothetical protein